MEYELARRLAIVIERSVRLENAPTEATRQAGGADEETETTEQGLPGQQVGLTAERPHQGLVQVTEGKQARDGEQRRLRQRGKDARQVEKRQQLDEDIEHH